MIKFLLKILITLILTQEAFSSQQTSDPFDYRLPEYLPTYHYQGYSVQYDARTKNPAWVYERLTAKDLEGITERSRFPFIENSAVPKHMRSCLKDYIATGFDKGHLAPAADNKASAAKMAQTFLLTNICPQHPKFNRGYWARLEKHVRDLTKAYPVVNVISGPLFLPQEVEDGTRWVRYQVIGENDVAVPTHFFKVLILENSIGEPEFEGFLLPNENIPLGTPIENFKTTIKKIEQLSGFILTRQPI